MAPDVVRPPAAVRRRGHRARGSATSTATSTRTSTSRTCRCSPATRRSRSWKPCRDAWRAGTQFLLPNEDAPWVAEELGRRYGLPKWQFTLSATHANTEAIRIARALTGRDKVLFFDGKYHGHFDEALVDLQDGTLVPEEGGLPRDVTSKTKIVQFNDPEALARARWSRATSPS